MTETPTPQPQPDSLPGRLADLLLRPGRLMDNVGRRPRLWVPYLLILVVMGAFMWQVSPIVNAEVMEMSRDSRLMQLLPPEAQEQMEEHYEQALHPTPRQRLTFALQTALGSVIQTMLLGLLLGSFAKLSGGTGRLAQALGITAWAGLLPLAVGVLVALPIVLHNESVMGTSLGLAALFPGLEPDSLVFQLLRAYGDFFTWWGVALLVVGFQRVYGLSRNAAIATVVPVWALAVLAVTAQMLLVM